MRSIFTSSFPPLLPIQSLDACFEKPPLDETLPFLARKSVVDLFNVIFYSSFFPFFVAKWQPVFIAKVAGMDDVEDKTGVGFWDKMICKVPDCLVNKRSRREVAAGCACRGALASWRGVVSNGLFHLL